MVATMIAIEGDDVQNDNEEDDETKTVITMGVNCNHDDDDENIYDDDCASRCTVLDVYNLTYTGLGGLTYC